MEGLPQKAAEEVELWHKLVVPQKVPEIKKNLYCNQPFKSLLFMGNSVLDPREDQPQF
jgi:hypothetical protein